jgi:hypothetical protein
MEISRIRYVLNASTTFAKNIFPPIIEIYTVCAHAN